MTYSRRRVSFSNPVPAGAFGFNRRYRSESRPEWFATQDWGEIVAYAFYNEPSGSAPLAIDLFSSPIDMAPQTTLVVNDAHVTFNNVGRR